MPASQKPKTSAKKRDYRLPSGKRVVGVTTVLDVLNKPGLVKWANRLGLEGIDVTKYVDKLADVGTCAHYLIQMHLQQAEPNLSSYSPEVVDLAENSFLSYLTWEQKHTIKPILCEAPLVSIEHEFGGTIDVYCELDGGYTLLDCKTSKTIYDEHIYQVSTYRQLLRENNYTVDGVHVLQIPRTEDEAFDDRLLSETQLNNGWQVFLACLKLYNLKKAVGM